MALCTENPHIIRVIGLGNRILSDDSIGFKFIEYAQQVLKPKYPYVSWFFCSNGGFDLFDLITGCDKVIIIDSVKTGTKDLGFCHEIELSTIEHYSMNRLTSDHGIHLSHLLEFGTICNFHMPHSVRIFGIEVCDTLNFSLHMSFDFAACFLTISDTVDSALNELCFCETGDTVVNQ